MGFDPLGWLSGILGIGQPQPQPAPLPSVASGQQTISGLPYGVTNYTGSAIRPVLEQQLGAQYDPWIDYALNQGGLRSYVTVDNQTVTPEAWDALRSQAPDTWGQVSPMAEGSRGGAGYAMAPTGQMAVATGGPLGYTRTQALHELMHFLDAGAEKQGKSALDQETAIQNLYRQNDPSSYGATNPHEAYAWAGSNRRTGFPYAPGGMIRGQVNPFQATMDQLLDLVEGRFPQVQR